MTAASLRPVLIGVATAAVTFGVLSGGFALGQHTAPDSASADSVRNGNHDAPKYAPRGGSIGYHSDWVEMPGGHLVRCVTATNGQHGEFGVSCDWVDAGR